MTVDLSRLDVPLPAVEADIARQKFAARMKRLDWLKAHPENATAGHATAGEAAEMRHLLYDADSDALTPAFPYPTSAPEPTR